MNVQRDGGQTVKTLSALILALAQPSGVKRFCSALVWERMCWSLLAPLFELCFVFTDVWNIRQLVVAESSFTVCPLFPVCSTSWMISLFFYFLIELCCDLQSRLCLINSWFAQILYLPVNVSFFADVYFAKLFLQNRCEKTERDINCTPSSTWILLTDFSVQNKVRNMTCI